MMLNEQSTLDRADKAALDYLQVHTTKLALQLARERGDRLQRAIMQALMELSLGQSTRATQTLYQALNG